MFDVGLILMQTLYYFGWIKLSITRHSNPTGHVETQTFVTDNSCCCNPPVIKQTNFTAYWIDIYYIDR